MWQPFEKGPGLAGSGFAVALLIVVSALPAAAGPINIALNPSGSGLPTPLESDSGWGGGSFPWEIVDGLRSYNHWAHGLAFTGGHTSSSGGPGWIEPAGVRQATINFGEMQTFDRVIIWHHGVEHTPGFFPNPGYPSLDYWDGWQWVGIAFQRQYGTMHEEGSGSGYSDSDIYTFLPVTGSKIRYSFDNSGLNVNGTYNIHGWLYEFEVFSPVPEPGGVLLMGAGLSLLAVVRVRFVRWLAAGLYRAAGGI